MRIGIVTEGFGLTGVPASEPDVDDAVRESAHSLTRLGCEVGEVSIPWHRDGFAVWSAIACEGILGFMLESGGAGKFWKGAYPTALIEFFDRAMHTKADQLSLSAKAFALFGRHIHETTYGHYYAKAQNLARVSRAAHDEALKRFDVLVMPTEPIKPPLIPPPDLPIAESITRTIENIVNTSPTNITGHPALSVPCAMIDGLPIGMMMIGRHGEDATILKLADALQRKIFMPPRPPART
jgi:amidase